MSAPPPASTASSVPADVVSRLRSAGCVFAEDEARLLVAAAADRVDLDGMVGRRVSGIPLEHVLGWAEFCGQRISVDPGVFVPRRRTEHLAREAASQITTARGAVDPTRAVVVVDLCCGSGAVAAALAATSRQVELHAVDLDPAAVRCARRNLADTGGRVHEGDLYEALPADLRGRVDVLVANAPYVPTDRIGLMPPEARQHEPRLALDGGVDGLDVLRRVVAGAATWLAPGGTLLVETSELQAPALVEAVRHGGLDPRVVTLEDAATTVVVATQPPSLRERRGVRAGADEVPVAVRPVDPSDG